MEDTTKEGFYQLAWSWGHRQSAKLGIGVDHAGECAQRFVVRLALLPGEADRWAWPPERIEPFLSVSARNHALNYRKHLRTAESRAAPDAPEDASAPAARLPTEEAPDALLLRGLFWEKVVCALSLLDPNARELLIDYHVHNVAIAEIAEKSGCSSNLACQRLIRARKRLRALLIAAGDSEEELRSCIAPLCRRQHSSVE